MIIRRATPDDAALLAEHRAQVWYASGHGEAEVAPQITVWAEWMSRAIACATYVALIASDDGRAVGSASLIVHDAVPRPGYRGDRDGRVHSVYVESSMRRRGIARALMHALLAYARETHIMRLTLHPTEYSRSLYASLGFEPLDEMGLYLSA